MKLSIIILNYNTRDLTFNCLRSLNKLKKEASFEIIVVDNGSIEKFPTAKGYKLIQNKSNLGFAGGNNSARKHAKGEFILFLNSDTEVNKNTLKETIKHLEEHPEVGAITCKTILPNGKLDKDARRSFPTPWVALTHFSGLDKIFPKSKIFAKYWYGYKSPDILQEIDALQGAFFMTKKEILDKVDWFSEDYFLDGEDIDLSWKIKNLGYKLIYLPNVSILHIKKASKKKTKNKKLILAGVTAMEIFYKKHLWDKYPLILNFAILFAIYLMKIIRLVKTISPL